MLQYGDTEGEGSGIENGQGSSLGYPRASGDNNRAKPDKEGGGKGSDEGVDLGQGTCEQNPQCDTRQHGMRERAYREGGATQHDEAAKEAIGKSDQESGQERTLKERVVEGGKHLKEFSRVQLSGSGRGLAKASVMDWGVRICEVGPKSNWV